MRAGLIAIAAFLAGILPCRAAVKNGNFMLPACQEALSGKASFLAGVCYGSVDALVFWGADLPPEYRICLPSGATNEQLARVFVRYMETHPDTLHYAYTILAAKAFHEAWPCKQ